MIIKKCKSREGYKVMPDNKLILHLEYLKTSNLFKILSWTPIAVIVRYNNVELVIHRYGELHFKYETDAEKVRIFSEEIYSKLSFLPAVLKKS